MQKKEKYLHTLRQYRNKALNRESFLIAVDSRQYTLCVNNSNLIGGMAMKVSNCEVQGNVVSFDLACNSYEWIELAQKGFIGYVEFDFQKSYKGHLDKKMLKVMERTKKHYDEYPTFDNLLWILQNNPYGLDLVARLTMNYEELERCEWIKKEVYKK